MDFVDRDVQTIDRLVRAHGELYARFYKERFFALYLSKHPLSENSSKSRYFVDRSLVFARYVQRWYL